MKVLHIAESPGGVEKYLGMILPRLSKKGVEQKLVCSTNFILNDSGFKSLEVERLPMRRSYNPLVILNVIKQVRKSIRQYSPDIVYCHSSFAGVFGRIACWGLPVKVVYNPHGWAFEMECGPLKRLIYKSVEKMLASSTDCIINISQYELKSALSSKIAPAAKMRVIENGIDFHDVTKLVNRADLGIPEDAFVIGMVGRISPQKAPDVFLKIGAKVRETIPNTWLLIVGDGELRDEILALAKQLNISDKLTITGWVKNAQRYINIFDQAILMSRWEGFGLAVIEYAKSRKPIIASNAGALPELIKSGENGYLVNQNDIDAAAELIIKIHNDEALRERLVTNGLNMAITRFNIDRVVDETVELFSELQPSLSIV